MMQFNIGICGSHRTGKTTLAKALAEKLEIDLAITSTSEVFKQYGLDPAQPLDFKRRLWIQQQIVQASEQIWQQSSNFVTDRTPLDMIAYTLADIQGNTQVDFVALQAYISDCFRVANKYFSHFVILQPAIPLIYEDGKAALNQAYIEHLNSLIIGLCHDERCKKISFIIERNITHLDKRVESVKQSLL